MTKKIPVVAFVGMPNSGKSTLLNRFVGQGSAIVAKEAHTTRDVNKGEADWEGYYMRFVDTGGLVPDPSDKIQKAVQIKSWSAIAEADLLVWVIDRKQNPDTISEKIIQRVWKTGKPFILAINKVDDPNLDKSLADYAFLGGNGFVNISCNTGYGLNDLLDSIVSNLAALGFEENYQPEFTFDKQTHRRKEKTKKVYKDNDGHYYIIRNQEGLFESVAKTAFEDTVEIPKPLEVNNIVLDVNGVILGDEGFIESTTNFIIEQKLRFNRKVYYLSNASESETKKRTGDIWGYFDGGLDSWEVQAYKPDPKIYDYFLEKYNLQAETCFYVDDSGENFVTARNLGFQAIHYKHGETDIDLELQKALGKVKDYPKVLFLGKPNVGKSSLFNTMKGEEIQIVTDIAGTTMSVNDTLIYREEELNFKKPSLRSLHLIFDFDGVLGDTNQLSLDSVIEFRGLKTKQQAIEYRNGYFEKPRHHIDKTVEKKFEEPMELKQNIFDFFMMGAIENKAGLFDSFMQQLVEIKEYYPETKMAIVTGNSSDVVKYMLSKSDYDLEFDHILGYLEEPSKQKKVEICCQDWGIDLGDCYYFTDTKADVVELENFLEGSQLIGCDWGYHGRKKLLEILPDYQILSLEDDLAEYLYGSAEVDFDEDEENIIKINKKRKYILLDSVGIRRPGQRTFGAETFATYQTIEAAHQADVICLVLDGSQSISHQDQVVAGVIKEAGKGVVVIANKSDLVEETTRKKFMKDFQARFKFLKVKDFLWVSAKETRNKQKKRQLEEIWRSIDNALDDYQVEIPQEELRKMFNYMMKQKPPQKLRTRKRAVIYDLVQIKNQPPTFELLIKDKRTVHWSYLRFIENLLRKNFGLESTQVHVKLREVEGKRVLSY